jgi:hypothetical protein
VDFLDIAGVVGDHRERLDAEVDAARRCVGVDGTAGVDVGAIDVKLEGHPPPCGLLFHGGADDPGSAVAEPVGQPRHVLPDGDRADAGQRDCARAGGPGAVGVVPEPGTVFAFTPRREPEPAAPPVAFAGVGPVLQPGRPYAARLLRHPRRQPAPVEPREQVGVGGPPRLLQSGSRPRHWAQQCVGYTVGAFGVALRQRGLDQGKAEVLHHPRQAGVPAEPGTLLGGRFQLDSQSPA